MVLNKKTKIILSSILSISIVASFFFPLKEKPVETFNQSVGASYSNAEWVTVDNFSGYQTKLDPTKVQDGANPMGQNTTINDGDRISVRPLGYEMFPSTETASAIEEQITSLHNFRKRSGENVLIRARGTVMEYFEEGSNSWEVFRTGLTSGKDFDFGAYNINTDVQSQIYFGNGFDDSARWTGAHGLLVGDLTLSSTTVQISNIEGFSATGTIILCENELEYTNINLTTKEFTLSATSTIECSEDRGIAQTVTEYPYHPKGNIYSVSNNRLFIAGIASTSQAVYFSEYGDATNFVGASLVTDSTDTSPGIFNFGQGGGAVVGIAQDEASLYFFKKSAIRKATLSDTIYSLGILKPFDDKGQTIGSLSNKGTFTGGNAVYFATADNQIMSLLRVETIDYPQTVPISENISPTVEQFNLDDMAGIVFRDKALFAVKSNKEVTENDAVLIYNIQNGKWDSPIIGWRVSDWAVYNDGTSEELYYADAISPNVYKVISSPIDGEFEVTANWRSKRFNFGNPAIQKEMVDVFVDGYIAENTTLTVSLLLDEDGYTQTFTTNIAGTDTDYIYDNVSFNSFGLTTFGTKRFGTDENSDGKKPFRVYLGKDFKAIPFYNAQIEFASDGDNQDWEVLSFSMRTRQYSDGTKKSLYKSFK